MTSIPTLDSPFCKLLGIQIAEYRQGHCKAVMPIDPALFNRAEMLHGGASFTLGDVAMGFAAAQGGAYSLTKSIQVEYLAPARGRQLSAIASIVNQVDNRVFCQCEVFADETLVCRLEGEFRIKRSADTTAAKG